MRCPKMAIPTRGVCIFRDALCVSIRTNEAQLVDDADERARPDGRVESREHPLHDGASLASHGEAQISCPPPYRRLRARTPDRAIGGSLIARPAGSGRQPRTPLGCHYGCQPAAPDRPAEYGSISHLSTRADGGILIGARQWMAIGPWKPAGRPLLPRPVEPSAG
jgi:hypothetical protein